MLERSQQPINLVVPTLILGRRLLALLRLGRRAPQLSQMRLQLRIGFQTSLEAGNRGGLKRAFKLVN